MPLQPAHAIDSDPRSHDLDQGTEAVLVPSPSRSNRAREHSVKLERAGASIVDLSLDNQRDFLTDHTQVRCHISELVEGLRCRTD